METLINNIRNEVTSYQNFILKKKSEKVSFLKTDINNLLADPQTNLNSILEIESELNKIAENEILNELRQYNIFDVINQEKIIPHFLFLKHLFQLCTIHIICFFYIDFTVIYETQLLQ